MGSGFRTTRAKADSPASGVRSALHEPDASAALAGAPRAPFESEAALTQIGVPDASLLALARGETRAPPTPRRVVWFLLGVIAGAAGVWGATANVAADVYRARMWAAHALRAATGHGSEGAKPDSEEPAAGAVAQSAASIPTVDVSELPRAKEEAPQGPAPARTPPPPAPGSPALQHAPGPR